MSSKIEEIRAARERLEEVRNKRRDADAAKAAEVQDQIHERELESINAQIEQEEAIQALLEGAGVVEVEEKSQEEKDEETLAFAQRAEDAVLNPNPEPEADTGVAENSEVAADTATPVTQVGRPSSPATPPASAPADDTKDGE